MRIVFVHPNYRSGGAEIAGSWPPAWVAYLAGHLRKAGFDNIHFIDAMTHNLPEEELIRRLVDMQPDVIGTTAITPSIYMAERVLELAQEYVPQALRVLGGIHATFMYKQVLSEAPWVDVIVRGEGEEIFTGLMQVVYRGEYLQTRDQIRGIAYRDGDEILATPAAPTIKDLDALDPGLVPAGVGQVQVHPAEYASCYPQYGPGLPVHLFILLAVEILARLPGAGSDKGRGRD